MYDKVLVALIAAAATVIAALIVRESRRRQREKLAAEKRSEILPEIDTRLDDVIAAFRSLVEQPFLAHDQHAGIDWQTFKENIDARRTKAKELGDRLDGLLDYHKRNDIWIPSDLRGSILGLRGELIGYIKFYTLRLRKDTEWAKRETDFIISELETQNRIDESLNQIDENLRRANEALAESREVIKQSDPREGETEPSAEPQTPTDDFDTQLDELQAELKRRRDVNSEILKKLGHEEDADKTSKDPLVQYRDKTREEVFLEEYEDVHTMSKEVIRKWLDTEASEKLNLIRQRVRELLGVDAV